MSYAELLSRSCYSLLEGASFPEELVEAACQRGVAHLGIVDRDGVYGVVQAHKSARSSSVHLICGATLTLANAPALCVLVENQAGWRNLCQLLTLGRAHQPKGRSELTIAQVLEHTGGLYGVLRPGWRLNDARPLREAFGSRLVVPLHRRLSSGDRARVRWARRLASALDVTCIASNDVRLHDGSRKELSDVLGCIRRGITLDELGRNALSNAEQVLLDESSFRHRYADAACAVRAAERLAESCTFSLSDLHYVYPQELVPSGHTADSWLRLLTHEGLKRRYPDGTPPRVQQVIAKELRIIDELGFPSYFLTIADVVSWARAQGILCQGRGSAANSAVCYALGITSIDPNKFSLLFERFINAERDEPPDIDVDFEHERREEVIQYIYQKYGRDRAAMVNAFVCYRQRSALRDVGKAVGLSNSQVDHLAKSLDRWSAGETFDEPADEPASSNLWRRVPKEVEALLQESGLDPASDRIRCTWHIAQQLRGFPRHVTIHSGGFVIADSSLQSMVPIEPATMEGRTVVQWDKYALEDVDFVKVDVLALGILTAIRKSFDLIAATTGRMWTMATIPRECPDVYDMFCRADTIGVFQIESRAQMSMLPRLKPRCFYDLVIEIALVRPGPIQGAMVHPYLRRREGEEPVSYPHPKAKEILERTLGVPLFQEQVMAMGVAVGGLSPGEADQLRRSMGTWRKKGTLQTIGRRLVRGMIEQGVEPPYAEEIFHQILGFGEYGFPESHSISFAYLCYVSGWLKCHHPAAFAAALINSQPMGFYSPRAILGDAQRHGVEVRSLCVVRSFWDCTLEANDREDTQDPALRLGFRLIRGLREAAVRGMVEERQRLPFSGLADFAARTGLDKRTLGSMADAGAFDRLEGTDRRQVAWKLRGLWNDLPLFATLGRREPTPRLPKADRFDILRADYRTTGFSVDQHPIGLLRAQLDTLGCVPVASLTGLPPGARLRLAGLVSSRQRPGTASGVVFMTFEDETGLGNLVIWPSVWRAHRRIARHAVMLGANGVLQRQGDAVSVLVDAFWELPHPAHARASQPLPIRSRNFR